jgi:F-type H+-transporting ATPase subunit c
MKLMNVIMLALAVLLVFGGPLMAEQAQSATLSGAGVGAGIGVAIAILGAGYGFGKIGSAALESMARQPEAAGQIQTAMIIIGALLEGATFFALIVCILISGYAKF